MSERFRPCMRLRHSREFDDVFRHAQRSSDKWVMVLARHNNQNEARLGLAISKKCARKAVDRNRIKRIIRESFRRNRHYLQGLDLVIIGRKKPGRNERAHLVNSLQQHWQLISERCGQC